jgi:hypothetical protein
MGRGPKGTDPVGEVPDLPDRQEKQELALPENSLVGLHSDL